MREVLNISLPEGMRAWLDQLVRDGGYANVSEYVRELIRADAKRRERDSVNLRLLEAIEAIDAGGGETVDDLTAWLEERKTATRSGRVAPKRK